jgi:tetratricopeptide (TPR) repeat protein
MRWRDLIIGGLITLVVTVLAGLIVWYLTREPSVLTEKLTYSVDYISVSNSNPQLGVGSIKIGNIGGKAAQHVHVVIKFPPGSGVRDQRVQLSSGDAASYAQELSQDGKMDVSVPVLAPDEVLSVTALVSGISNFNPTVSVKSDETVGTLGTLTKNDANKTLDRDQIFKILGGALAAQIAGLVGLALWRTRVRSMMQQSRFFEHDVNNVAFVYIQKKQIDDAEQMLSEYIRAKGGDVYYLANHGLALGLQGKTEASEARLAAAEFLAKDEGDRERALIQYNRAVLHFVRKDIEGGKTFLATAMRLHPQSVREYSSISDAIAEAITVDPTIRNIIA